MNTVFLDIETSARPATEIVELLPTPEAPSNYRDPVKIEQYLQDKRAEMISRAALDAVLGRVLVVGFLVESGFEHIAWPDERQLLRDTWKRLSDLYFSNVEFVTFNGHAFDLPFLARRSWLLGVPVPVWFPRGRRFQQRGWIDLMEVWQAGNRTELISLDRLARSCGLPGKTASGADFAMMWEMDRQAAFEYLERDLRLTESLATRMLHPVREPVEEAEFA